MDSRQLKAETIKLDKELKDLRIAYEKYFIGIDKREPIQQRAQFKSKLNTLRGTTVNNTALRFKLGQIQGSLTSLENHWNRVCRQIEEGTYKRDRLRAQKRLEETQTLDEEAKKNTKAMEKELAALDKEKPATSTKPSAPKSNAAPKPSSDVNTIHQEYQKARKSIGQAGNVSLAAIERTIAKQTAVMQKKLGCDKVNFRVAVKDGKVILKASRGD